MAKTKKRTRIAALVGALLFFATSIAFSILVVVQLVGQSNKPQSDKSSESGKACDIGSQPGGEILLAPEIFKPAADVTKLEITDLIPGDGPAAKAGDCLLVKYYGTLATTGVKFDGNFDKSATLRLKLGQGEVISGWDQGLVGLKVGGTRRLVIPSELAYKDQANQSIPANSDLVFVIKLVNIQ